MGRGTIYLKRDCPTQSGMVGQSGDDQPLLLVGSQYLPREHVQGVKQLVCPSGHHHYRRYRHEIARSGVLDICVCYKHNQSVDIGEKLVSPCASNC